MNHWLDQTLVALLLLVSAVYALMALGPKALRLSILAASSQLVRRAPRMFGLAGWAQKLEEAATKKAKGACGGCEDCGSGTATQAPSTPMEIKIPVTKIGRRS